MKQLLLAFTLMTFYSASAQNYQTVRSNQINYYGTPNLSYILATRTDSIDLVGLDSIFFSYKTVRENDTTTSSNCAFLLGPNWYGEKVIIKDNGENLFFNKQHDTIHIQTQAHLNDTFLVYVYPSGLDSIYGWITSEDTLTILGQLDSVKTIEFFSTSTFLITPGQASFSKNHGFVQWFASYSFPEAYTGPQGLEIINYTGNYTLVGHEFPRVGITKPRVGEIFDFEIGDRFIFQFGDYDLSGGYWTTNYLERTVIDKYVGIDSVHYVFHDTSKVTQGDYSQGNDPLVTYYGGGTQSISKTDLMSLPDSLLPEEFNFSTTNSWNYLGVNDCGKLQETNFITSIGYDNLSSNCIISYDLSFGEYSYVSMVGIGTFPAPYGYEFGYPVQLNSNLLYYSKVLEDTCGTNSYMALDDFTKAAPSFLIYPNPTNTNVTIRLHVEPTSSYQITIGDLSGKIVYTENVNSDLLLSGYTLPTSQLESGIYLIVLNDGENRFVEKLVRE